MPIRETETQPATAGDEGRSPIQLLVYGVAGVRSYPLPRSGALIIGRDLDADIRVEDPQVSRAHALLHVGPAISIEDSGSANGTRVRGEPLPAGQKVPVEIDTPVQIGGHILVLRRACAGNLLRRICRGPDLERRLDEECARAVRDSAALTVASFHVDEPAAGARALEILGDAIRASDVLGADGACDFVVIMPGASAEDGDARARQLGEELRRAGIVARAGVASLPRDGRTAGALLARLSGEAPAGAVVESEALRAVFELVERAAATEVSVLVLGETGAGKDVLAQHLHASSPRAAGPFVRINCAAFTETLLESELFGYEKGAFTGATAAKPGLLETAGGGTAFLDEVGEMPPAIQAKLLHAIEAHTVLRVGALRARPIDVRFVAATNRDLAAEMDAGRFRADLYYRLAGFAVTIPPLRERSADILPLARRFLARAYDAHRWSSPGSFSPAAIGALLSHTWPGNIRELRNAIEWAALLSPDGTIELEHLPIAGGGAAPRAPRDDAAPDDLGLPPEQMEERQRIVDALAACGGNQTRAARKLGMARSTLILRLDRYRIPRPIAGKR